MTGNEYYIHDIDPVIFHIWGNIGVRYYGLAYALGFVFAIWMFRLLYKKGKIPLNPDQQFTAMVALFLGVIIGGRLGHMILYDFDQMIRDPLSVLQVWHGGMASHGGFAGVVVAAVWIARHYRINFALVTDILAVMTPCGLMLGRIANFLNGELWGKVTDVPWAVIFPYSAAPGVPIEMIPPRHPSQLYEAALEGAFLLIYSQWRVWKTKALDTPGRISGEFLILYAIGRIICEQFKESEYSFILGLPRGIFYSLFMIAGGLVYLYYSRRRSQ